MGGDQPVLSLDARPRDPFAYGQREEERMHRIIAFGMLVLLFGSLPAMAQTYSVVTRVGLGRPGCDGFNETVVELTNFDPNYSYKVRIEGVSRVAHPGPSSCGAGISCSSNLLREVELAPASQGGTCGSEIYQMPSHNVCPGCVDNCDNRTANCAEGEPTCGNPSLEWCMELVDFKATIIQKKAIGSIWKNANVVIASKGVYGSSPAFTEESYCTAHAPIFQACQPPPPPPGPPLDE